MAKKILRVYPNPFIHLDHDGYPAGLCPCDMVHHVGMTTRKFVGATLDQSQTMLLEKLTKEELLYRDARQQTRWKFDFSAPTDLPMTDYYMDRVRDGEILVADKETQKLLNLSLDAFVSPKDALAREKAAALHRWEALHGPGEKPEFIDIWDQAIAALGRPQEAPEAPKTTQSTPKPPKGA